MQDWTILEQLWRQYCDPAYRPDTGNRSMWRRQVQALYANNIAHPVALQYLLQERPGLDAFREWISTSNAQYQVVDDASDDAENNYELSAEQIAFWQNNGYLVLPSVITAEACAASCDAIWQFLGADLQTPSSWYQSQHLQRGLMAPLYNHPRLNTNRASKRIRAAYEQLYGHSDIYKSIDHVSFNPPETTTFSFRGSPLHWDVSLAQPIPDRFQGLLYLTDCKDNDGAFHCVPGFQNQLADWLNGLNPGEDPRQVAEQTLQAQAVPGNAGDFVIWHQALPHCATANRGRTPRMVQYLTYIPNDDVEHSVWI
ncbi:phytanoyl-CoA dioxygenase family protein [Undibacterium seohonense]|jgi:ectoine hydroxylase-related dioxygenase (phytanoyl-CoA dioxygenase family)|uniref:Phytanoyl-CoA dioxygenase family protein n=1 Tax=Undibacterium seohonense TaxID=1344950 RepID=A0ABR6X892_9BURK|nr:phytanoyl-CoA dioxygenase family protein [Undibacterium seohonense]MBC3809163.1 phytanoyl-CoA dioxygenase family protein [Undibacterium seohonense]